MPRVSVKDSRDEQYINTILRLQDEVRDLKASFANKLRLVEQASQPTLSVNGEVLLWRRTGDDVLFMVARANGTDRKIQFS